MPSTGVGSSTQVGAVITSGLRVSRCAVLAQERQQRLAETAERGVTVEPRSAGSAGRAARMRHANPRSARTWVGQLLQGAVGVPGTGPGARR